MSPDSLTLAILEKRYFLRAWWTVEGATHDLFMAASHMYAVRIVVLNLEDDLEVRLNHPPRHVYASVCRDLWVKFAGPKQMRINYILWLLEYHHGRDLR